MFDSFLNVFLNSVAMLLYYQCYYSFWFTNFFYFIIPFFYHTHFNCFKWAFVCYHVASFLILGYFTVYFDNFSYFISFLSHPFLRRCLAQRQFIHILQYVLCCFYVQLLTLICSMPFYCFNHYFNDILMVTPFKQ